MKASRRRTRAFEVSSSCRRSTETLRDQNSIRHQDSKPSAAMILTGFVFLTLTAALSPAEGQEIKEITANSVILTCSGSETVAKWYKKNEINPISTSVTYEVTTNTGVVEGEFSCEYKDTDHGPEKDVKHLFFLNVKVCENCYELTGFLAAGAIIGDLLVTGAVILIVYMCVSKNTDSTQQKASKLRTAGAPPPPNPDYERLNHNTRSTDLYAGLHK
ncbi:T-cell surface glycoprotein CD3 epsilon chain-like [Megalobrama amblycephala]|uniref:T-cell surface glycoprotein CD3 epsilon chain-like n=1 Tax=Megalobrama amblycephala TaxID=75352 RepID=UPI00201413B3|nr:T-cell surface glycoprotein CD3 epsilon chain-like [Megalobrama amblycephala]